MLLAVVCNPPSLKLRRAREEKMAEKEKEAAESEVKRVIKDYVLRMLHCFETLHGWTDDDLIQCPSCGHFGMSYQEGAWRCPWVGCYYQFPEDMAPPSPSALEAYYNEQKNKKREKIANLLKDFNIQI